MKSLSIATFAMLKRFLPLPALILLLTAISQGDVRTTQLPSVSVGSIHNCGVTTAGAAYCWGWNGFGQLGNGTNTKSNVPVAVTGGLTFQSVSAGLQHSCGVTTAGTAYCWGENKHGRFGNGTETNSNVPVAVTGGLTFQSVSGGFYHSCGVTTAGTAYCWGNNRYGLLGNGTNTNSNVPVLVDLTFSP